MPIAYTTGSKGIYIGAYRGTCDLGFQGAIDDVVRVGRPPGRGDDRPGDRTGARHADADRDRPAPAAQPAPAPPRTSASRWAARG